MNSIRSKLLDPGPPERVAPVAPSVKDLGGGSPLDGHFRPPAVKVPPPEPEAAPRPAGNFIPDDYNPLAPETGVRLVHDTPAPFDLADIPDAAADCAGGRWR